MERMTHRRSRRDDLLPVFNDNVDVRVRFSDEDRLRANASAHVDEHGVVWEVLPGESCMATGLCQNRGSTRT